MLWRASSITVVVDGSVGATLVGDKSLGGCTLVKQVADGGAAAFAGVQPGARLISFNGVNTAIMHKDEVVPLVVAAQGMKTHRFAMPGSKALLEALAAPSGANYEWEAL